MHDIKLYDRIERDVRSLIHMTRIYSCDTGMSFRHSRMVTKREKREKRVRNEGIELPEGEIADINDSYKYLGVPWSNDNHKPC